MELEDIDLTTVGTSDLLTLSHCIEQEHSRRRVLEESPHLVDELATKYLRAAGRLAVEDGAGGPPSHVPEYVQPLGAYDAYPLGIFVTQEGRVYRSLRSGNVWAPRLHPEFWGEVGAERQDSTDPDTPEQPLGGQ